MILSFVCFNTCRNYNLCNNQLWSETDFCFSEKAEEGQIACNISKNPWITTCL